MVDNLELHARTARNDVERLRRVVAGLSAGRGSELGTLVSFILDRFQHEIDEIDASLADVTEANIDGDLRDDLLLVISRKYERLQSPLDVLYETVGMYEKSVDRADVPVGLQHLVDVLMDDLLASRGDPMIHLDPVDMYSTVDLVAHIDSLFGQRQVDPVGDNYDGVHPIVFNLPALDPANALLSPLIAHEVTHTAARESLMETLASKTPPEAQDCLLKWLSTAASAGAPANPDEWVRLFQSWCEELVCDAVALALTGPSFLFAFSAYLPPSNSPSVGTHPPLRDRVAFHLSVLRELGWIDPLKERLPNISSWFEGVGAKPLRTCLPIEGFLLEAMEIVSPRVIQVALSHVTAKLDPQISSGLLESSVVDFKQGIPSVESPDAVLDTWQVILAGWFAAFDERGDSELALLVALDDPHYSAMLIKALEMSSIVTKWRRHEHAGA